MEHPATEVLDVPVLWQLRSKLGRNGGCGDGGRESGGDGGCSVPALEGQTPFDTF